MVLRTGWTGGLFSTGAGGSPGLLLLECSLLKYLAAEPSDSSLTVRHFGRVSHVWNYWMTILLIEIRKLKDPADATIYKLNWVKQC